MRRKAVSPVIATLLLIVIAVAAAVLTYLWVTGYMGTVAPRETPMQLEERIKIDAVKTIKTGEVYNVQIYVANIGENATKIVSAYVLTSDYTVVCGGSLDTPQFIDVGQTATVDVSDTCNLNPGVSYIAKVSTIRGVEATYTFRIRA
uniref:Flagellar biosynthesis protein FlaG n=1 Tax=Thermofilum pendens TaxID=2269 RepID=A0A7C3WKM2_THEPE